VSAEQTISRSAITYVIRFLFLIKFFPKINEFSGDHDNILGGVDLLIPVDSSFLAKLKPVIVTPASFFRGLVLGDFS